MSSELRNRTLNTSAPKEVVFMATSIWINSFHDWWKGEFSRVFLSETRTLSQPSESQLNLLGRRSTSPTSSYLPHLFQPELSLSSQEMSPNDFKFPKTQHTPTKTATPYDRTPSTPKRKLGDLPAHLQKFVARSKKILKEEDPDSSTCQLYSVLPNDEDHGFYLAPFK